MVPEKRHTRTLLRREIIRALGLTSDPDLMAKLSQQLIDLLGVNKGAKAAQSKVAKGTKQAETAVQPGDSGLLGG